MNILPFAFFSPQGNGEPQIIGATYTGNSFAIPATPNRICSDGSHLYIADPDPGSVYKYTFDGTLVATFDTARSYSQYNGITYNYDNNTFVLNATNNFAIPRWFIYDGTTFDYITEVTGTTTGFKYVRDITYIGNNTYWIMDSDSVISNSHSMKQLDSNFFTTGTQADIEATIQNGRGLTNDGSKLWANDIDEDKAFDFNFAAIAEGNSFSVLAEAPIAVAIEYVASQDKFYVANYSPSVIYEYQPIYG